MKITLWLSAIIILLPCVAHADWGYYALRFRCDKIGKIAEFEPFVVWNGKNNLRGINFKDLRKFPKQKIGKDTFLYVENRLYSSGSFQCRLNGKRVINYELKASQLRVEDREGSKTVTFSISLADMSGDIRNAWDFYGPTYNLKTARHAQWTQCFGFEPGDRRKGECLPIVIR